MATTEMKSAGDDLFLLLTKEITENKSDLSLFVNSNDSNIYLVETRDRERYFIVRGHVRLTDDGQFDNLRTSTFLIVRNARTGKPTTKCPIDILKVIDYTSLDQYLLDLRDALYSYLEKHDLKPADPMEEFRELLRLRHSIEMEKERNDEEDIFAYASRIGNEAMIERYRASEIISYAEATINRIWKQALYYPEYRTTALSLINRIATNTIKLIDS